MRGLFILLLAVMVIILSSCVVPIKEGTITKLIFTPAHTDTYITYNKVGNVNIPVTHYIHIPDKWEIQVKGTVVNNKGENKEVTNTIEVTQLEYNSFDVGQHVFIRDNNNNLILGR